MKKTSPLKRYLYQSSGIALLLLSPTVVCADGFGELDSNADGVLSGRELRTLKLLDQNGDGELSRSEFQDAVTAQRQRVASMVGGLFGERDRNSDGRLSGTELSGIEYCDSNNDKRITEEELAGYYSTLDPALQNKTYAQLEKVAEDRFNQIDLNEDGRLTGTEASGASHFDQNADGRITKDEYFVGTILAAQSSDAESDTDAAPAANDEIDTFVSEVVSAMNDASKTKIVYQRMHEKLREITDLCILEYAFQHAQGSHGKFKLPVKKKIKQSKLANGAMEVETDIPCPQGKLTLNLQIVRGKITALGLISPEMNLLDKALFDDLHREEMQNRFAEAYGKEVENAVKLIVNGEDDNALQLIHPSVVEQIGKEPFEGVFKKLRSKIERVDQMEIETFAANQGENDIYTFTVTYLVKYQSNAVRFGCTFQRAGLCSVMTGMSIENHTDASPVAPNMDKKPTPAPPIVTPTDSWIETVSIRDGVKFKLPGESERNEKEGGKRVRYEVYLPKKKMFFSLEVDKYDFEFTRTGDTYFETFKKALLKDSGRELLQETLEPHFGFPSQILAIKNTDGSFTVMMNLLAVNTLYSATWRGPDDSRETKTLVGNFFDTIVLIDAGGAPRSGSLTNNEDLEPPMDPTTPPAPAPAPPPAPPAPR